MAGAARPDQYGYGHGPPPGQGYYSSYPGGGTHSTFSDDTYDRHGGRSPPLPRPQPHQQQHRRQQQQQPYFDPPPTNSYPASVDEGYRPYEHPPPPEEQFADYGSPPPNGAYNRGYDHEERPYAPTDPGPHEGNQLAPFDEEKAEAEWNRGVNEAYTYSRRPPPPPSDAELGRKPARQHDERDRVRERERRHSDDRYYDDRERERSLERRKRKERERRKREDEERAKEKALRYPSDPKKGGRDVFGGSEGERGWASKLVGGAGGAWIAHEATGDALGTLGGLLVGAIAANAGEKFHQKKKEGKALAKRDSGSPHDPMYPPPGRDMEDVRRTGRDGRDGGRVGGRSPPGEKAGLKDRVMRSLSRVRSKSIGRSRSRPRRRSGSSRDSEDTHYR